MRYDLSKRATICSNENASISDCARWKTWSHLSLMIPVREGKGSSGNNHGQEPYNNLSLCTTCPHTQVHTSLHSDLNYNTKSYQRGKGNSLLHWKKSHGMRGNSIWSNHCGLLKQPVLAEAVWLRFISLGGRGIFLSYCLLFSFLERNSSETCVW